MIGLGWNRSALQMRRFLTDKVDAEPLILGGADGGCDADCGYGLLGVYSGAFFNPSQFEAEEVVTARLGHRVT